MADFRIPKRFKLLGHTVEVVESPEDMYIHGRYGHCGYETKVIKFAPKSDALPVTKSSNEHTFVHELVHMCLNHTSQEKLNKDEAFIDLFAGLLHQALTTMEFE